MNTNTWYSTVETQRAFLRLPPDDQKTLELQHWIIADAMNIIYDEHRTFKNVEDKDIENVEVWAEMNPVLKQSVDDLKLSTRARNVLRDENIYLIWDLVQWTDKELLLLPNFWKFCLNEIQDALKELGLSLGTIDRWRWFGFETGYKAS